MKWCFVVFLTLSAVGCSDNKEREMAREVKTIDHNEKQDKASDKKWNPDIYQYAREEIKNAILAKVQHEMIPKELTDPNVLKKLPLQKVKEFKMNLMQMFEIIKRDVEKGMDTTMEKLKHKLGHLDKDDIDKAVHEIAAGFYVIDEFMKKGEL